MSHLLNSLRRTACLLPIAALATSCGGGGGGSDSPTPPSTVQVTITAPASGSVLTAQTPIAVQAQISVNGSPVADGTAVSFSMPGGSFSPVAPQTRSGLASTSLTGTTAGAQTLTARSTVNGATGTGTQTIYLRPQPAALEILVPAYFHPTTNTGWSQMAASASANPAVGITAILNPSNGIFTTADAATLQAARNLVAAGGKVIGYVYTRYGTGSRSLADIKTNIDRYLDLYGSSVISGIFLDEMSANETHIPFYREIYDHIKARGATLRVVGNPGLVPAAAYASATDAIVSFEGAATTFQNFDPRTSTPWLYTLTNSRHAMLVHNADNCAAMQTAVQAAASARYNHGLVYATNLQYNPTTQVGNPWASLPSYWSSLVGTVRALNTATALPAC